MKLIIIFGPHAVGKMTVGQELAKITQLKLFSWIRSWLRAVIERNKTENRLINKPSKRNLEKSETLFNSIENMYRLNSFDGELAKENYIRINNSNLLPEEAALIIKNKFTLI